MLKKRKWIIAIVLCLVGVYGGRVYAVNSDVETADRQIFKKGESVPYGNDFNISSGDICNGYTLTVMDSKVMAAEEFCEKYKIEDMGNSVYEYMVKVSVENVSNQHEGEQGVSLGISMLVGENYVIVPSPDMFKVVNPKIPGMSFSLRTGTKKEIWLVFEIMEGNTPDYSHLQENRPLLQITQYPHQKLIRLS